MAARQFGAAAYAIGAPGGAAPSERDYAAAGQECPWQCDDPRSAIRDLVLVLVDQRQRNEICWDVFAC